MKCTLKLAVVFVVLALFNSHAADGDLAKATAETVKPNADPAAVKALLAKVIDALAAKECETNEVARKEPQNSLDKIEFFVSRPGADAEREAYCKLLAERLAGELHAPAKIWLLKSLERIGKAESVAAEVKLLSDADETVRETARRALALNASDESSVELRKALDTATEPKARIALIEALGFKRNKADAPIFEKEAQNTDAGVKAAALAAFTAQGVRKEAGVMEQAAELVDMARSANAADIPKLVAALDSPIIKIRQAAVQAVNLNPSAEMTKALIEKLKAAQADVKPALIAVIAQRGDKTALSTLSELSAKDEGAVRVAAIQGIGYLGDDSSVAPLMALAVSGKGDEQKYARESLDRVNGADVDKALAVYLKNENLETVKEATQRLAARNTSSVAPELTALLAHSDQNVRIEALKALGSVAGKEALAAVLGVLSKTEIEAERDQAAKTIVAISRRLPETDGHVDALVEALKGGSEPARIALLTALGQIGGSKALDAVRAAMSDASEKIQDAAFRSLTNWPDAAPMTELLALAKSAKNDTHRVLALRGFVRMAALPSPRAPQDTLVLLSSAYDAVKTTEDRKLYINALSEVKHFTAIGACAAFIKDHTVTEEACIATVKVAKNFESGQKEHVTTAMKTVLENTKNAKTKEQAQAILDKQAKN